MIATAVCSNGGYAATSRKQHIYARAEQHVGGGKFTSTTEAGFCHEPHSSCKCPHRLPDPLRVLLILIPFAAQCHVSKHTHCHENTIYEFHLNVCLSCARHALQHTHTHTHTHDASTPTLGSNHVSDFICHFVRLSLMNHVRERLDESNSCSTGSNHSGGEGTSNSSCHSSRISSPRARGRRFFCQGESNN